MKTLIILLLMTSNTFAFYPAFIGNMKQMTSTELDACTACPMLSAGAGNVACEDLEKASTNYLCDGTPTWSEATSGTGAAIAEDTSHSGTLACTDKGTHALQLTYPSDAGSISDTLTVSAMTSFYYKFYLNIVNTGLSAAGYMPVFVVDGTSYNNHYIRAVFDVDADHYKLQLRYRDTLGNTSGTATTGQLTEGTWYQVAVEGITNSNTLKMWVGTVGGTQNLINSETNAANDADPVDFVFGRTSQTNNSISGVFQIDNFKLDNTSMPGDCSL